jgi:hypothetical protein
LSNTMNTSHFQGTSVICLVSVKRQETLEPALASTGITDFDLEASILPY